VAAANISNAIYKLMTKELNIETERTHVFVLTYNVVYIRLEWPAYLVDRLPDDFTLILSGPQLPKQERTKSDASYADYDLIWFEVEYKDKTKDVMLEATGNGKRVLLWRQQVAGNLAEKIIGAERLYPLLAESAEVELAGKPTGGMDIIASNVWGEELYTFRRQS
jgi:hypothetical protein